VAAAAIARFNDLDRLGAALRKLTKEEEWIFDAMSDVLDRRIEARRIREPAVH
jgi:hypothetical protein